MCFEPAPVGTISRSSFCPPATRPSDETRILLRRTRKAGELRAGRRGRDATGPRFRQREGRASRQLSSPRTCARAHRAGTADRSRSPAGHGVGGRSCRRPCLRRIPDDRRAKPQPGRPRNGPGAARACARPFPPSSCSIRAMAPAKSLSGPAHRAENRPGSPSSASTQSPESSASAGRSAARAAAAALISAFSTKVEPVSSGSGKPRSPADRTSSPKGRNRSRNSCSLPALWVAMTRRRRSGSGMAEVSEAGVWVQEVLTRPAGRRPHLSGIARRSLRLDWLLTSKINDDAKLKCNQTGA